MSSDCSRCTWPVLLVRLHEQLWHLCCYVILHSVCYGCSHFWISRGSETGVLFANFVLMLLCLNLIMLVVKMKHEHIFTHFSVYSICFFLCTLDIKNGSKWIYYLCNSRNTEILKGIVWHFGKRPLSLSRGALHQKINVSFVNMQL